VKIKTFVGYAIEECWALVCRTNTILEKSIFWVGPESVEHMRSSLEVLSHCTITVNKNGAVNSSLQKQAMILCS
jgi:hypothetical protein